MRLPVIASLAVAAFAASSHAAVLYDGSVSSDPTGQGLTYASIPFTNYYAPTTGGMILNTSAAETIYAGFTPTTSTTLDRNAGFTLRVDAQITANTSSKANRSGFSLIALSSDLKGIEIGFHGSQIQALEGGNDQNTLQTVAESTAFDFATNPHRYDLTILGNTYTLRADGSPILTGAVRDYTAYSGAFDVYETPNFVFLGDDTTSAGATTKITYVSIVPEPTTLAAMASTALLLRRRR